MLMYRRLISFALAVAMVAGMLPGRAAAAELETVPEETVAETTVPAETVETEPEQTETVFAETEVTVPAEAAEATVPTEPEEVYEEIAEVVIPDAELPESGELYDAYLERLFYGNQVAFFGTGARERLTEMEQKFYDYLKAEILKIAAGQRTSTRIEIKKDVLVQWGLTVSFDVSAGTTTNEKATIVHNGVLAQVNRRNIINALMYDCPYEMYWYDKTVGTLINSGCSLSGTTGTITRVMFNFRVVGDMKPSGYAANNPTIDTSSVTTAQAAAQRAREIAAQYEPYGDYEKLVAFKDEICGLTSYDYASASHTQYTTDADPWQLIYVFDGDSNTKVVCEGYAKAFQYLFDLSTFQGEVESRIIVGELNGGGHMWNVVAINGKNYMADVTNSDAGTAGSGGELFLAGTAGSVQGGYTFLGHRFTYTENTIALWGEENLRLESSSYVPLKTVIASGTCGETLIWTLTKGGLLTISGYGEMPHYLYNVPWAGMKDQIVTLLIKPGVTQIGAYAFYGCSNLTEATLPDTLTYIGYRAFYGCSSLTGIDIPEGITVIIENTFENCSSLKYVNIPDTVTTIEISAFEGCTSLESFTIPASVTSIHEYVFYNCTSLTGFRVDENNPAFSSDADGVLYNKDKTWLIQAPAGIGRGYTIPGSVTEIGWNAFSDCDALEEVWFLGDAPVGDRAFEDVTATVYYPYGNPTWTAEVRQSYSGDLTWVGYCGHEVEKDLPAVAPTCELPGLGEGKACANCGQVLEPQEKIPALGHRYDNGFCSVCGALEPAVLKDGVYEIGNAGQLYWFAEAVNGGNTGLDAKLVADIVVNEDLEERENLRIWTPIGSEETPYRGSFDGQGHSITGLFLDNGGLRQIGLFGYLESATVSNVTILNSLFYGGSEIGGIAGYNNGGTISGCTNGAGVMGVACLGGIVGTNCNGTIENCRNEGAVHVDAIGSGGQAGGIVGKNIGEDGGKALIQGCTNEGSVYGSISNAGGIAGTNNGTAAIEDCSSSGHIWTNGIHYSRGYNTGGITGLNDVDASISGCTSTGTIDGQAATGGIAGTNQGLIVYCFGDAEIEGGGLDVNGKDAGCIAGYNSGVVQFCMTAGTIRCAEYAGGLVGNNAGIIRDSYSAATILYPSEGGIAGSNVSGQIINCYFDGPVSQTMDYHLPYWKTTEQFASGEVTWLLNGGLSDENVVWHQNIGTDTYPGFSGGTVYRNQTGGCLEENFIYGYENAPAEPVITHSHKSVVTAPTCTAGGFTTYTCVCGDTYEADRTDPLPHREAILEAVAPTCEDTGLSEGKICPDCQTILLEQETVPATGHDFYLRICRNCGLVIDADYRLYAGKSMTLKATNPETGKAYTSKEVSWSLAEAFAPFATVTAAGKVTARKVPERVRVEVLGTVLATGETISVLIDMIPAVTQVELLFNGEAAANNETVRMGIEEESGTIDLGIYPADTLAEIKWSVSDKKNQYAEYTVERDCLTITNPTGKSGTVTVTATVDAGARKTVTLKVAFGSFAETVEIAQPDKTVLRSGESLTLTAAITAPERVSKPGITWTSSNKNAATVSTAGRVTARSVPHPTVVTITATSKDGLASDTLELTVLPKEEGKLVLSDGETMVTGTTLRKNPGDSFLLSAMTVTQGIPFEEPVVWSSSRNTVATVSETGVITCVGIGTARLTAMAFDGRKAEVTVKVSILAQSLTLRTKDGKNLMEEDGVTLAWVASGKSLNLAAEILPARAAKSLQWQVTEGAEYAKVANGKLTASKNLTSPRYVTVLASTRDGSGVSGSLRVKILPLATGVQVFEMGMGVRSNTTYVVDLTENPVIRLSTRVYPAGAHQKTELTSSNKKIAAFDENGDLVCFKTGTVTITAKALDGSGQKTAFTLKVVKKVRSLTLKEGAALTVVGGKTLKLAQLVQINPGDATNKKLTWSAAPNDLGIKVSASGILTTKKVTEPVTVNIMVTTQDDSGCMLSFDVTVKPA